MRLTAVLTIALLALTTWAGCLDDGGNPAGEALAYSLHCEGGSCNVAVTEGAGPVNEPSIAVNPTDPCNLIVGGNDYNGLDVWTGVYVSFDCGRTWTRDFLPGHPGDDQVTPFSQFTAAGDAAIAFAPDGTAYYAGIAFTRVGETATSRQAGDVSVGLSTPASLIVARSEDGGRTWPGLFVPSLGFGASAYAYGPVALPMLGAGAGSDVTPRFEDKEWITVAPDGTVYLSWTRYGGVSPWLSDLDPAFEDLERPLEENEIYLIRSDDRGETWTDPVRVSRHIGNQGSVPVVSADGTLHIIWSEDAETVDGQNLGDAPINILVRSSADKGQTFGEPVILDSLGDVEPDHRFRVNGFPSIVVDPPESPHAGRLTATWAGNRSGDSDIWMAESTDGGVAWTTPVRVNQDPIGNGAAQYFPWVAVGPDGVRSFVWYDARHDPSHHSITVWMAQTLDGVDFTENEVTDAPFHTDRDGFATSNFLGDYLNVAASSEGVFSIWPDTRTATDAVGNTDLFVAWLEPPVG